MQIERRTCLSALLLVLALAGAAITAELPQAALAADAEKTNRLAKESSPYLLLHAHNPVDWYPWGEEAIARSRAEQKPIFLSVGYSSCYWCHVMEREAFSNLEIAAFMNEHFVNVKVDREERPELDEIYMTATQLIGGRGGWPNSVFLTPNLEPFFAGTYFSEEDKPGRPGFQTILTRVDDAWRHRRGQISSFAAEVVEKMKAISAGTFVAAEHVPPASVSTRVAASIKGRYDSAHGGFGQAPKFPSPGNLLLLWDVAEGGDDEARRMVVGTLRSMARGGLFDLVGGGFHRYSVDARWDVPHFEKMLYDNALLAALYVTVGVATDDAELIWTARRTLEFLEREMRVEGAAFKSAIDAETDGEEGAYYVWTREELERAAGETAVARWAGLLRIDEKPNFEGSRYTLRRAQPIADWCSDHEPEVKSCGADFEAFLGRLLAARSSRPYPLVDDKVLTDWNAMTITAFARAGRLLEEPLWVGSAEKAADFLLRRLGSSRPLLHSWRLGRAHVNAFLDDYAYLVEALLELDLASAHPRWMEQAERLAIELQERLSADSGGFYLSAVDEHVLFQARPVTDGAIPAGNSVALRALIQLAQRGDAKERHREAASRGLRAFAQGFDDYPQALPTLALALREFHRLGQNPVVEGEQEDEKND